MVNGSNISVMAITLLLVVGNACAVGDWEAFPICEASREQSCPAVSGDVVVWMDKRTGGFDIYSYNLSEPNEYAIETAAGDQKIPAICDNIIVWMDAFDIIGYDISGASVFAVCDNAFEQEDPAISGNVVVWRDQRNFAANGFDIYGCDISDPCDPCEFSICTEEHGQYYPDIDGNIVVWLDVRNAATQPDIYGYNLDTQQEFEICTHAAGQYYPQVSGDVVVWKDTRDGNNSIYGYRISTQTEFLICSHTDTSVTNPDISGNLVVWQDKRNGDTNSDIYGYDLDTETEFPICTLTGAQINPAIDGDMVVWQRDTGDIANIYGAYRPEPVDPSVLTVLAPNGDETILAGSSCSITWQSTGPAIGYVRLDYSVNSGAAWVNIVPSLANTGSYQWSPVPAENSQQCLIRISDVGDSGAADTCDGDFTIFQCDSTLTADLDGDCFVDIKDFALFSQQWLQGGNPFDPLWVR